MCTAYVIIAVIYISNSDGRKKMSYVKNIIILCLLVALGIESFFLLKQEDVPIDLVALNQMDAYSVTEKYLLAHKTGEKELLTLRLLDQFYDKSEEYLSTHSDVFNVKNVNIKNIEELKMNESDINETKRMSEEKGFVSSVNIEDVKKFKVEYVLTPINEQKGFLIDENYDRTENIILIKRYGIWKIFDHGNA